MALTTGTFGRFTADTFRRLTTSGRVVAATAIAALGASAMTVLAVANAPTALADPTPPGHLVISEVNGDQSGVYSANWVELYNPTDAAVRLGTLDTSATPATVTPAYFLCAAAQSASTCPTPYKLYGTVLAHHHFLVELYDAGGSLPELPAGVTPDLNFAGTDALLNPSQQGAKNIGGYSTGGQLLLLDASVDKNGAYPTTANVAASKYSVTNRNLADASINPSPVVDAIGYTPAGVADKLAGAEGWTSTSDVHSAPVKDASHWDERTFGGGVPQDTNDNAADFVVSQRDPISQASSRVAVAPVKDAEISRNEAMPRITVAGSRGIGTLSYAATGLPDGVAIDPATGTIDGTPATADTLGKYPVTVTVSDQTPGTPDTASTSFTLTLSTTLRVDPIDDVSVELGAALAPVHVHPRGGTPGYTYSATGLPAGVAIASDGTISGTPAKPAGKHTVHVTVTDSGSGTGDGAAQTAATDFTFTVRPAQPGTGDPLAGLKLNEVEATGTPAKDWIEVYDTGDAITDASVDLTNSSGAVYHVTGLTVAHGGYAVVEGTALDGAGLDLAAAGDTVTMLEPDGDTELDRTTWTSVEPTSWARTADGTGAFDASAYATKGTANPGAPTIEPNDLLVTEVNYDNNSTDYYEYSEVTNTTDHAIDFAAYGLTLTKSGVAMTTHDPSDTSSTSPAVDPVIPAHGTQLFWWVETQYYGVKTTHDFLANYGLDPATPVVLVFGFSSLGNSGGDHSYDLSVNHGNTLISQARVDTPCAANTLNGSSVCTATNRNYAEHFEVPADRTSPVAAVWYNSLHSGGDDIKYPLTPPLSTPGTVDLEQLGFTRAVKITSVTADAVTLHNTSDATVDLANYVLQKNAAGADYSLPSGTSVGAGEDLLVRSADSGLTFAGHDYATLYAPEGYDYTNGIGIADTTGPFLRTLAYDASSGEPPVIDPTTGLPLPPAGGLYRPAGVSARNGTVYASNTGDNLLAALANGSNTVIAGALDRYGFDASQDNGPANASGLYQPGGSAVASNGDVYFADSGDNMVLEITKADGKIHRVAGTGTAGGTAAAITASSTGTTLNLYRPESVAVAGNGDLYIADTYDNRVVKVAPSGAATLVAGTGKAGYTGDGTAATAARLSQPADVELDSAGNVYVADASNNVIRRVDAGSGVITTVAGDYAADQATNSCLGAYSGDGGPATKAQLNDPQGIAVDGAGNLFIADTFNNAVREVAPDGTISTVVNVGAAAGAENTSPVGGGTVPTTAKLNTPYAVTVDAVTNALYVADTRNSAIAEVVHVAEAGDHAGAVEPADQIAVTGSGKAFAACDALSNPPVVTGISPATGADTGGTSVTITGSHFTGTTAVNFGTVAGLQVRVVDDSHLTVTTPAHLAGHVDVTVTNAAGVSSADPADQFTYLAAPPVAPVVTRVSPSSGPASGATIVTITGRHLTGTTGVRFGTVAGSKVVVTDDSHVRVTSPAHAAGRVDVTVSGAHGRSSVVAADRFTFTKPPTPTCTYAADYAKLAHAEAELAKHRASLAVAKRALRDAHKAATRAKLRKKIASLNRTIAADRRVVSADQRIVRIDSGHSWCHAQVVAVARLTHALAKLAKDLGSLAKAEAALKRYHNPHHRAALRKKIAALHRTIAADRRAVAAARRALAATR